MKNKYVFITIVLIFLCLKSYTQQWNWAQGATGGSQYFDGSYGVAVATDASGAVYTAGNFWSDNVIFGSNKLPNHHTSGYHLPNMFVICSNSNGVSWATNAQPGTGGLEAYGITANDDGVYVTGTAFYPPISFYDADNINGTSVKPLANHSDELAFLVKYNSSGLEPGTVQWSVQAAPTVIAHPTSVTTDVSGNVYITGAFQGNITFYSLDDNSAGTLTNNNSYYTIFIASYDSNGNFRWAESPDLNGDNQDWGTSLTSDGNNIYLAGYFESSAITFPLKPNLSINSSCTCISCTSCTCSSCSCGLLTKNNPNSIANDANYFLVKFDECGNLQWAINNDIGGDPETPYVPELSNIWQNHQADYNRVSISADNTGNIYMTGYFISDNVSFGTGTGSITPFGSVSVLVTHP